MLGDIYRVKYTVCILRLQRRTGSSFSASRGAMADSTSPTIRDLARELNVSHTTVSRVLHGKGDAFISDETRRKVMDAAARLNYRPHRVARALATGRTGMIALWTQTLRQP